MTRNRPNIGDWRWFDNNMCAGDKFQTSPRGNHDTNKGHECQPLQQGLKKSENPGCFAMSRQANLEPLEPRPSFIFPKLAWSPGGARATLK